jgi:hypothetical protein
MSASLTYRWRQSITWEAQVSTGGSGTNERLIYEGTRATGVPTERQLEEIVASTSAGVSLRVEL